jgi:hypothetical protein
MLLSVPTRLVDWAWWVSNTIIEVIICVLLWRIDSISEEVHSVTSSRWHIDPGMTSSSCAAPIETGKLASAAFAVSIMSQIIAIIAVHVVMRFRFIQELDARRSFRGGDNNDVPVLLEGLPEFLYACHGILGFVVSSGISYRALGLLFITPIRYRVCPHKKVVGMFKFACVATSALSCWYFNVAASMVRVVVLDLLGVDPSSQEGKRR